jgi:multidrug efflux pump subunit AcrA (membrane-fusion protein)
MSTATLQDAAAAARARAETAQRAAAEAQAAADLAVTKAREAADARLRADAEQTVKNFDRDLAASEQRVVQARDAFNQQAVAAESFTTLRDRYLAWTDAASGHFYLHWGLTNALGRLGVQLWRGRAIPAVSSHLEPPAFSVALDDALKRAVAQRNEDREDRFHARILGIESGEIDG